MKRRDVLKLALGAVAWPRAAQAQQPTPLVGFLGLTSPDPSAHGSFAAALRQGLSDSGFVEGRNLTIEYRWAHGNVDQLPKLAAELVSRRVAVVATIGGDIVALSAKKATTTVPIVFISGGDPVELKLIQSFNRPGGNVTGVSVVTAGSFAKRLEILREMVPGSGAIGLLANPTNPGAASMTGEILEAARALNQPIEIAEASAVAHFEPAIAHLARRGVRALLPHPDVYYLGHREQLVSTVARHRLPAIYHFREFAVAVW